MKSYFLRTHGITKQDLDDSHGKWYWNEELGFNYRLTDFQASLGITQLAKNQDSVKRRNEISSNYKKAFRKLNFRIYLEEGITHTIYYYWGWKQKKLYDFPQKEF